MGGKGKAPPPIDPGQAQGEYLFGKGFQSYEGVTDPRLQEKIIGAEETFRPRYAALELKDIQTFAEGLKDPVTGEVTTPGVFDLLENQSQRAFELQQAQLQQQREADVRALEEFSPQAVEAFRSADPYSTEIAESMSRKAMGQLTPEEERSVQQRARQGSLARGRIGDSSSLAAEALGRSDYTSQFAQPAFAMNRQLSGDLGMTILGRPSSGIQLGGQMLGQATGLAGQPIGPQLFDPNVGINMALQQRGQDMELAGANAQARGAIIGGALGGAGAFFGKCWVAREVYGEYNPKWIEFREWLTNKAPRWFDKLYVNYGERFAKFISNKPRLKSIIRNWMDTRIK